MILKSLELNGFKSFPDKTVLNFEMGSTMVVGPNGSGNSNISDAMRWVLGEKSSRNIRGTKMEDVIFGGTDKRRQMSYAEVSVTFDNAFVVRDIKVIEGQDKLFVAMPSRKLPDGEFKDIAHPINSEMRNMIETAVLEKYQQELESAADEVIED